MYASLCVLAYKRPDLLRLSLDSLFSTCDYPYQLIINLDGADSQNLEFLQNLFNSDRVSNLIFNSGNNRGVGRSFQNCLGVAEGDYIFKIDTDIIFKPKWLSSCIKILENNPDIGTVSPFD